MSGPLSFLARVALGCGGAGRDGSVDAAGDAPLVDSVSGPITFRCATGAPVMH